MRTSTRRGVLSSTAAFAGSGLLAACGTRTASGPGGAQPSGPRGKVIFMSQGTDPGDQERYKPLVEQFNARGGPVTIDLIQGDPGGSAVHAQAKLIALVASGTPPDLFWTHAYITPNLIKLGLLEDISPYMRRDRDFNPANYFEAPFKDYEANGKQYGIPREATTTILIVNKDLFQKLGVPLPTENWTWDDYLRAAQALTGGSGPAQTWGVAGWGGTGSASYYAPIKAWQEGGDIVDATRTKFTLHLSPAVEQMQWVADLITKHRVHPFGETFPGQNMAEAWNTGRIGMVTSICVYTNFNKATFEWDIAHLPRGTRRVTRTASAGHSMTAASKNKDAAWEVLKFLGSKPAYEHWAKLGLTIPTFKEVAASPLVLNPNTPPKSAKIAQDAFAYARPEPIAGDWGNVQAEIGRAMNRVYASETDAKSALSAIVQVVESLLAKVPEGAR